jgi:O-antigen/teichoic acid export membrane protein
MLVAIFGTGIRAGANLLLIPIVLIKLSAAQLAVWWVFVALGNFGNLADFGFGQTLPRVYNFFFAGADDFDSEGVRLSTSSEPNFDGIRRLNVTIQSLYFKISLAAMTLLAIGGTFSLLKPAAESGMSHTVWWLWAGFIFAIGYNLGTTHWVLAVQGLNRMRDIQFIYIWGSMGYVVTAIVLLYLKLGILSMVIATFVKGFINHGCCHIVFRRIVPATHEHIRPDPRIVRKLWPNAYKFGILALGAYFLSNAPVLICSQFLGKDMTASFGTTVQIGSFMSTFGALWLSIKWPEITILRTQGRLKEMSILFGRRLLLVVGSFICMSIVILLAGNRLLAWKGAHTRLLATPYLALYLFYVFQQITYSQFGTLACTENVVPFFKTSIFTGLGAAALSLCLTPLFGLWGLLLAPLIAESVYNSWYNVRRGFQGQPLTARQFVTATLRGHV